MKLNATALGVAGGIIWGVSMLILTWICMANGYAAMWLEVMASVYPGYNISFGGSIIGLLYGFADGFIGLFILGWLYNRLG